MGELSKTKEEIQMALELQCRTIIEQMGGFNRLRQMVGLTGISYRAETEEYPNGYSSFRFKGNPKMNHFRISLNGGDTYDVEFWKVTPRNAEKISSVSNVYCDMLIDVFEETTGLLLSIDGYRPFG